MADGFRKALFGFNCDDVIEYIKKTHKEYSDKETVLNEKIEELTSLFSESQRNVDDLKQEKARLEEKLAFYTAKEDEINQTAEKIGDLYILSKANARAIIDNAEESRRIAKEQVEKNLNSIKEAHDALEGIVKGVTDSSVEFTDKVKILNSELEETKQKILINEQKNEQHSEILSSINEND